MNSNAVLASALLAVAAAVPAKAVETPDTMLIPERAVVVTGDHRKASDLVAVLYNRSDLHYSDPNAPRFLFFDREGRVAFGIGGYAKGTLQYDFDGSINDGSNFTTYDIPVPTDPAQRNAFDGTAAHSTIFLQLVGRSSRFGMYQMYIQTNFSGNGPKGYGLKLRQAYVSLGNVTAGYTRSTFIDGAAGTPVIEDQGPSGETTGRNVMIRYSRSFSNGLRVAGAIEVPSASITTDDNVKSIRQRVPDIPVYVQYSWGGGKSHIRATGLFRDLYYRDLVTGTNRSKFGWAAQLSGVINSGPFTAYFQGAYGKGYGYYINDLSGNGFDLIPTETPGEMKAPRTMNYEVGVRFDFTKSLYVTGVYSQARVFGTSHLSPETFRRSQYIGVSGFYEVVSDLSVGLQYLHGNRWDINGESGNANRIMGMLKYSF